MTLGVANLDGRLFVFSVWLLSCGGMRLRSTGDEVEGRVLRVAILGIGAFEPAVGGPVGVVEDLVSPSQQGVEQRFELG